jgi:hypothetical protein
MGWTVLYIAFGAVALWLLGEVLLQYKARLRWRLLAFFGFLTVVVGVVLLGSVVVIALGGAAFAVGQTLVTLSYRKGFVAGWALDGLPGLPDLPGLSRRGDEPEDDEYDDEFDDAEDADAARRPDDAPYPQEPEAAPQFAGAQQPPYGPPQDEAAAYAPLPLPEETGEYGVYHRDQDVFAGREAYQNQQPYPEQQPAYQEHQPLYQDQQGGYGQQQETYAAYSDPYIGYGTAGAQQAAASYDAGYGGQGYGDQQPGGGYDAGYGGYDPSYPAQQADPYAAAGYPAQDYPQQSGYDQQGYPQTGYQGYDDGSGYGGYTGYETGYGAGYGGYQAGQDPYAAAQPGYGADMPQQTPAEGVWVPQPREGEDPYQAQAAAQGHYPQQDAYGYYSDQRGGY